MEQWMSFGGASNPSPWEFGWNALAAIGALVAAGVALFIHFHQQSTAKAAEAERRRARTAAIAPQLVADVMQLDWRIAQSMRAVMELVRAPMAEITVGLERAWAESRVQLVVIVGHGVQAGDLEWLTDDVRLRLAQLRAQVSVANAMWRKLLSEDPAPLKSRQAAVESLLKGTVHQVVDTTTSCILLLDALNDYLPDPLKQLVKSIERQQTYYMSIYKAVPEPPLPKKPVPPPPAPAVAD